MHTKIDLAVRYFSWLKPFVWFIINKTSLETFAFGSNRSHFTYSQKDIATKLYRNNYESKSLEKQYSDVPSNGVGLSFGHFVPGTGILPNRRQVQLHSCLILSINELRFFLFYVFKVQISMIFCFNIDYGHCYCRLIIRKIGLVTRIGDTYL